MRRKFHDRWMLALGALPAAREQHPRRPVTLFAALFFLAAGLLFIVRRREVNALQKAAIGARLPNGCAVAEGVLLIALAVVIAIGARWGWF